MIVFASLVHPISISFRAKASVTHVLVTWHNIDGATLKYALPNGQNSNKCCAQIWSKSNHLQHNTTRRSTLQTLYNIVVTVWQGLYTQCMTLKLTDLSSEPTAKYLPHGLHATPTGCERFTCPSYFLTHLLRQKIIHLQTWKNRTFF